jgi:cytochrome c1
VPVIRKQIVQGGGAMPPVTGLSEQDLADLLAYLQTL